MNQKYIDMIYYDNHLEHHGVLGQKWGVENGPPYPLGRDVQETLANGEFGTLKSTLRESAGNKTNNNASNEPNDKVSNLKKLYSESRSDYEKECEKVIDERVSEADINKCIDLYIDYVFSGNKAGSYKKAEEREIKAWNKYDSEVKKISENIFGDEGNKSLNSKFGGSSDTINMTLKRKLSKKIIDSSTRKLMALYS